VILADTSAWVEYDRATGSPVDRRLTELISTDGPLAVTEPDRPLRRVLTDAGVALMRRPGASVGLALALLAINVLGTAAAVLPLLTVTVAYSFVAAARFALPQLEEGGL